MFSGCGTCRTEPYIRIRYSSETGGETPDHSSDEYPAEEHLYLCFPCDGGVPAYAPVGDVYGASELFCEADAAVHENGAPKANSGDEGNGRHTR